MATSKTTSTKKPVAIKAEKAVKPVVVKTAKSEAKNASTGSASKTMKSNLSVSLFDKTGKSAGTISLPESVFGQKVNKSLLHQAIRVYLTNQRQGTSSTKSRGEVELTKAKWYRQKGTGRARHGAQSAPIFVGGGVAHGPKPRNFELSLSKVMRTKALQSAFSSKYQESEIFVIDGLSDVTAKTKAYATLLNTMISEKGRKLIILPAESAVLARSMRNITGVYYKTASDVTTYDIISGKHVIISKDAISMLEKRVGGEK
jgi:large subunit ribosomal protein L4